VSERVPFLGAWRSALGAVFLLSCSDPPAPPKPVAPPPPVVAAVVIDAGVAPALVEAGEAGTVAKLVGEAQVQRQGTDEWVSLTLGTPIRVGDRVRTSEGGEVELSLGVVRMRVTEESQIELTLLTPRQVKVDLTGSGEATLSEGEVSFRAGNAEASAKSGKLSLTFDGESATAAALEGQATLTSGGKSVDLKSGEFSTVRGGALGKATRLPKNVALEVAWPEQEETNRTELVLRGKTNPQARLLVMGKKVNVGADGRWEVTVPLKRGKQTVTAVATDPAGRKVVRSKSVVMDPDAPSIKGKVEYK
jgi:hypothetical protein